MDLSKLTIDICMLEFFLKGQYPSLSEYQSFKDILDWAYLFIYLFLNLSICLSILNVNT